MKTDVDMIKVEEALATVNASITPTNDKEKIPLVSSRLRVLAEDTRSDIDIPPFDRATMDGYAVVSSDGQGSFEVAEYVPAGSFPKIALAPGKVSRIMTGAPVPKGADAVIQVENSGGYVDVGQHAKIMSAVTSGANIAKKGEDVRKGDVVLKAGTLIEYPEIATLASVGADPVSVYRRPSVAILATGDELVLASSIPAPGQIRESNSLSLYSQVSSLGITPVSLGIARDIGEELAGKMSVGANHDFLLVSGGVSEGDRDETPAVLEQLGYEILIHKVRIRPGKPLLCGVKDGNKWVFGLPGNPVSAMVIFELFIKDALLKFQGWNRPSTQWFKAVLKNDYKRKKAEREEYVPVFIEWDEANFVANRPPYNGSGHFHALTGANGLMKVPIGVKEIGGGDMPEVKFIRGAI
ncbi:MAG: molybdopterin molybdotransferase MoeA [Nitrospinae bacterium]|nr:molybdopterin molybdotransferase MoeA [Nitrospinota bacterium]